MLKCRELLLACVVVKCYDCCVIDWCCVVLCRLVVCKLFPVGCGFRCVGFIVWLWYCCGGCVLVVL